MNRIYNLYIISSLFYSALFCSVYLTLINVSV